jgi:hypothetical protein
MRHRLGIDGWNLVNGRFQLIGEKQGRIHLPFGFELRLRLNHRLFRDLFDEDGLGLFLHEGGFVGAIFECGLAIDDVAHGNVAARRFVEQGVAVFGDRLRNIEERLNMAGRHPIGNDGLDDGAVRCVVLLEGAHQLVFEGEYGIVPARDRLNGL